MIQRLKTVLFGLMTTGLLAAAVPAGTVDLGKRQLDPFAPSTDAVVAVSVAGEGSVDLARAEPRRADGLDRRSGTFAAKSAGGAGCPGGTTWHVAAGESIQAAVDAAGPGDRVLVGPGVYNESVQVTTPCLTLKGGWGPGAADWAVLDGTGAGIYGILVSADDVRIEGFEIRNYDGPPGWGGGVIAWEEGADGGYVNRNWIHDVAGSGVDLGAGPDGPYTEGWEVKANRIADCGQRGINLERVDDAVVKNNDVQRVRAGIFLRRNTGSSVRDNRVEGAQLFGIMLNSASGNEVKDNELVGSRVRNLNLIWASDENVVKDNLLVGSAREGLYFFLGGSSYNLVQDNVVLDSGGDGISLDSSNGESHGNVYRGNVSSGSATGCDYYWDGDGDGNCWHANAGSQCPGPLPDCH